MNNTSDSFPSSCLYSQDLIVNSDIYKDIVLPVLLPLSFVVCFMTTFTNLIVICTIIKTTSLHSPSNFLILGMAISDFGVGVFGLPVHIVSLFYELYDDLRYYCMVYDIFYCVMWLAGSTSILTLGTLTTDRFVAVFSHLKYAEIVTSRRVGIALLVIWVYSIMGWLMYYFITERVMIFHEVVVFITIVMDIYFMIKINRCVRRHVLQIKAQQQAAQQTLNIQTLKRSVNPMYYMFGAFVCCCFPYYSASIAVGAIGKTMDVIIAFKVSEFLFLLNSLLNPVIYFWRIAALRTAGSNIVKDLWQKNFPCCMQ